MSDVTDLTYAGAAAELEAAEDWTSRTPPPVG
jgi:hypothetical protein